MRHKGLRELISHTGDQEPVLPLVLKPTLPIGILTVTGIDDPFLSRGDLHGMDLTDKVLHLHPVGPDILNGTGSHITGDHREVLGTIETRHQTGLHHFVPDLSTATGHPVILNPHP